jgi:hypothetical protein
MKGGQAKISQPNFKIHKNKTFGMIRGEKKEDKKGLKIQKPSRRYL